MAFRNEVRENDRPTAADDGRFQFVDKFPHTARCAGEQADPLCHTGDAQKSALCFATAMRSGMPSCCAALAVITPPSWMPFLSHDTL